VSKDSLYDTCLITQIETYDIHTSCLQCVGLLLRSNRSYDVCFREKCISAGHEVCDNRTTSGSQLAFAVRDNLEDVHVARSTGDENVCCHCEVALLVKSLD
jgi:hypothetical protein